MHTAFLVPALFRFGATINTSALRSASTQLSPISAEQLFHAGELDECLEGLIGSNEHWAAILGTRCFIRSGRLADAEATIEGYWKAIRGTATDRERGETAVLRGAVAAKLGKRITALAAFCEARGYLLGVESSPATAELENHQALFALNEGDFETALHCAEFALENGGLQERTAARGILAVASAAKGDFRTQIELFRQNFDELAGTTKHNFLLAFTVQNIAILAQQHDRFDLYQLLCKEADRIKWTKGTKKFESSIYRELGLLAARVGDHLTAFRYLRRSAHVASDVEQQLLAVLDGATVAREINETIGAADRVSNAVELASKIDWSALTMHQRVCLLTLAEEQTRLDPKAARATIDRVLKLHRKEALSAGPSADQRFQAVATQAIGVVLKSEGSLGLAASHLQRAFTYWRSIDFGWGAVTTALELLELTGENQYSRFIEEYLSRVPSSHLRRRFEAVSASFEACAS